MKNLIRALTRADDRFITAVERWLPARRPRSIRATLVFSASLLLIGLMMLQFVGLKGVWGFFAVAAGFALVAAYKSIVRLKARDRHLD
jgi:hypothetical protein